MQPASGWFAETTRKWSTRTRLGIALLAVNALVLVAVVGMFQLAPVLREAPLAAILLPIGAILIITVTTILILETQIFRRISGLTLSIQDRTASDDPYLNLENTEGDEFGQL